MNDGRQEGENATPAVPAGVGAATRVKEPSRPARVCFPCIWCGGRTDVVRTLPGPPAVRRKRRCAGCRRVMLTRETLLAAPGDDPGTNDSLLSQVLEIVNTGLRLAFDQAGGGGTMLVPPRSPADDRGHADPRRPGRPG